MDENNNIVFNDNLYNYYCHDDFPTEYYFCADDLITIGSLFRSYNCTRRSIGYSKYDKEVNILKSFYSNPAGDFWIKKGFLFPNYKETLLKEVYLLEEVNWFTYKKITLLDKLNNTTFNDFIEAEVESLLYETGTTRKIMRFVLKDTEYLHINAEFVLVGEQGYLMVNASGEEVGGTYTYYLLKSEFLDIFTNL